MLHIIWITLKSVVFSDILFRVYHLSSMASSWTSNLHLRNMWSVVTHAIAITSRDCYYFTSQIQSYFRTQEKRRNDFSHRHWVNSTVSQWYTLLSIITEIMQVAQLSKQYGTNKSAPVDVNFINNVAVLLTLNSPKKIATKSYSSLCSFTFFFWKESGGGNPHSEFLF